MAAAKRRGRRARGGVGDGGPRVVATARLAQHLGHAWYSVEIYGLGGTVNAANACEFLATMEDAFADEDPADEPFPFAEIRRAVAALPEPQRVAWYAVMIATALADVRSGGAALPVHTEGL